MTAEIIENQSTGYIKVYRSIGKNWIWEDAEKLKWWLDILLTVNYSDQKVLIGELVIECKRGQSIKSLETWAKRWRTNKSKVRRFFYLLQSDNMIVLENVKKTTRLTVCNYESYNDKRNDNETKVKRSRNDSETIVKPIKEREEGKESKEGEVSDASHLNKPSFKKITEEEFFNQIAEFKSSYPKELLRSFYEYWREKSASGKMKFQLQSTWELSLRLANWQRIDNEKNKKNGSDRKVVAERKLGTSEARIDKLKTWGLSGS